MTVIFRPTMPYLLAALSGAAGLAQFGPDGQCDGAQDQADEGEERGHGLALPGLPEGTDRRPAPAAGNLFW